MFQDSEDQLIVEKRSQVLPVSTDREIDPTGRKSQIGFSVEGYFSPIITNTFRVSLTLLHI